jgi:hypothetical protein
MIDEGYTQAWAPRFHPVVVFLPGIPEDLGHVEPGEAAGLIPDCVVVELRFLLHLEDRQGAGVGEGLRAFLDGLLAAELGELVTGVQADGLAGDVGLGPFELLAYLEDYPGLLRHGREGGFEGAMPRVEDIGEVLGRGNDAFRARKNINVS